MKKLIFISALFLATHFTFGQNCEYLTNEKDEFTGAQMLETWGKLIREFTGSNANLIVRKIDSNYYLLLNYNLQYAEAVVIGTDEPLMLKLENDEVINVYPTEIVTGERNTVSGITTTQVKPNYSITEGQIQQLANVNISKVRVYFSDGYREHETKPKNAKGIRRAFECILE